LGILAPGTSYTRTGDLPVPNGLSGTFYVQLRTAGPFEFIYTDNNAAVSGPVTIALSPSPDLVVTSIVAPTASTEGGSVDITWTVANQGDAAAVGSWRDRIALAKPGDPKAQPLQLGSFVYDRGLGARARRGLPQRDAQRGHPRALPRRGLHPGARRRRGRRRRVAAGQRAKQSRRRADLRRPAAAGRPGHERCDRADPGRLRRGHR